MYGKMAMRVAHSIADLQKQIEPLPDRECVPRAIHVDRDTIDILHHEVRIALRRCPGVENRSDVGMT